MNLFDSNNSEANQRRYVLDANYFIQASRLYYDLGVFPCFWKWTLKRIQDKTFILIDKVYRELVEQTKDELSNWVTSQLKRHVEKTDSSEIQIAYTDVIRYTDSLHNGNSRRYESKALEDFANVADSWLIAYAKAKKVWIVTNEISEPRRKTKIKIPDICHEMRIPFLTREALLKQLHPVFDCEDFDR